MTTSIEDARANLALLEAEAVAEKRAELTGLMRDRRKDLAAAEKRYPEIVPAFREAAQNVENMRAQIGRDNEAISECLRTRPRVCDYLHDDPECIDWHKQHSKLIALRDGHAAELGELVATAEALREEGAAYEGETGITATLRRVVNNLANAIDRLDGKSGPEGGISGVS